MVSGGIDSGLANSWTTPRQLLREFMPYPGFAAIVHDLYPV